MGLRPGMCNNKNGRPSGCQNKNTRDLRTCINNFLQDKFEQIITDFEAMDTKDRIRLYIDLLQYSLPRLQSIRAEVSGSITPITWVEERIYQTPPPIEEELTNQ